MRSLSLFACLLLAAVSLSGCGQKGPLHFPEPASSHSFTAN